MSKECTTCKTRIHGADGYEQVKQCAACRSGPGLTPTKLAEFRSVAELATDGPWKRCKDEVQAADVRKALGLMKRSEYLKSPGYLSHVKFAEAHGEPDSSRRTGRTTEMLILAVAAASNGKVVHIVGHHPNYTRVLVHRARGYCETLGLDPLLIQGLSGYRADAFYDHHYWEAKR